MKYAFAVSLVLKFIVVALLGTLLVPVSSG
jgi:hypothetical protein